MQLGNQLKSFSRLLPSAEAVTPFVLAAIIVSVVSLMLARQKASKAHRDKGEQNKEVRDTSGSREACLKISKSSSSMKILQDQGEPTMEVAQLWIYPIKSIRGCAVSRALLTRQGFEMDRKFMLLHVEEEGPQKVKNMHVSHYPSMCLFHPSIKGNKMTVSYRAAGLSSAAPTSSELEIPLLPSTFEYLKIVEVNMHHSATTAYDMGSRYNDWFSEHFGFKVIFVHCGGNTRQVLGNLPGKPATNTLKLSTFMSRILDSLPLIGPMFQPDDEVIAFNDCAPYLVITEESAEDVSSRLPDGIGMDISKFRANIILKGSNGAFDEDFWGEILLGGGARLLLTANCGRCVSLNVDYETGEFGRGPEGAVLKLLSKDRRVDPGVKYSPIFGRYGFLGKTSEGETVRVGEKVAVHTRLDQRTKFYWPGLSTT